MSKHFSEAFKRRLEAVRKRIHGPSPPVRYDESRGEGEHVVLSGESWSSISEITNTPYRNLQLANPGFTRLHPGNRLKIPGQAYSQVPASGILSQDPQFQNLLSYLDVQAEAIKSADNAYNRFQELNKVKEIEPEFGQPVYMGIGDDGVPFPTSDETGARIYYQPSTGKPKLRGRPGTQVPAFFGYRDVPESFELPLVNDNAIPYFEGIDPQKLLAPDKTLAAIYRENPELRQAHALSPVDPIEFLVEQERGSYEREIEEALARQRELTLAGEERIRRAELAAQSGIPIQDPALARAVYGPGAEGAITETPIGQKNEQGERTFFLTFRGIPTMYTTEPSKGLHLVARYAGQAFDERIRGFFGWMLTHGTVSQDFTKLITLLSASTKFLGGQVGAVTQTFLETLQKDVDEIHTIGDLGAERTVAVRTDVWERIDEPRVAQLEGLGVDVVYMTPFEYVLLDTLDEVMAFQKLFDDGESYSYSLAYMAQKGLLNEAELQTLDEHGFSLDALAEETLGVGYRGQIEANRGYYKDRSKNLKEEAHSLLAQDRYDEAEVLMMAAHDDQARSLRAYYNPFWQPTWLVRPDLELEFRRNVARAELMAGEQLSDSEILQIRNQTMDGATELIPQILDLAGVVGVTGGIVLDLGRRVQVPEAFNIARRLRQTGNVPTGVLGRAADIFAYADSMVYSIRAPAVRSGGNVLQAEVARLGNEMAQALDFAVPVQIETAGGELLDVVARNETLAKYWGMIGDHIATGGKAVDLVDDVPAFLQPYLRKFDELAKVYDTHNFASQMDAARDVARGTGDIAQLDRSTQQLIYRLRRRGLSGDELVRALDDIDNVISASDDYLTQGGKVLKYVSNDFSQLPKNIQKIARTYSRNFTLTRGKELFKIAPSQWKYLPGLAHEKVLEHLKLLKLNELMNSRKIAQMRLHLGGGIDEAGNVLTSSQLDEIRQALKIAEAEAMTEATTYAIRNANKPGVVAPRIGNIFREALLEKHAGVMNAGKYDDALTETLARAFGYADQIENLQGPVKGFLRQLQKGYLNAEDFSADELARRLGLNINKSVVRDRLALLIDGSIDPTTKNIFETAEELGVRRSGGGMARRNLGRIESGLNWVKKMWIYSVLHASPRWTARNLMDSKARAVIVGGNMTDDINVILRRLQAADAFPEEIMDAFGRQFGDDLTRIQKLLSSPDADFNLPGLIKSGIPNDWKVWLPGKKGKFKLSYKSILKSMGSWRSTSLADNIAALGKPFSALKDGVAASNTMIEVTLRMRVYDKHFFEAADALSPGVLDQALERFGQRYGLTRDDIDALTQAWNRSKQNPAALTDFMNELSGASKRQIPASYSLRIPDNFREVADLAGLDRQTARLVQDDLDALLSAAYNEAKTAGKNLNDSAAVRKVVDDVLDDYSGAWEKNAVLRAVDDAGSPLRQSDMFVPDYGDVLSRKHLNELGKAVRTEDFSADALKDLDEEFVDLVKGTDLSAIRDDPRAIQNWVAREYDEWIETARRGEELVEKMEASILAGSGGEDFNLNPRQFVDDNGNVILTPSTHAAVWDEAAVAGRRVSDEVLFIDKDLVELRTLPDIEKLPAPKKGIVRVYQGISPGAGPSSSWSTSRVVARDFAGARGRLFYQDIDKVAYKAGQNAARAEGVLPKAVKSGDEIRIRGLEGNPIQTLEDIKLLEARNKYLLNAQTKITNLRVGLRAFTAKIFPGPLMGAPGKVGRWDTFFDLSELIIKDTNDMLGQAVKSARTLDDIPTEYTLRPLDEILENIGLHVEVDERGIFNSLQLVSPSGKTVYGFGATPYRHFQSFVETMFGPGIPPSRYNQLFKLNYGSAEIGDVLSELGSVALSIEDASRFIQHNYIVGEEFGEEAARLLARTLPDGTHIRVDAHTLTQEGFVKNPVLMTKQGDEWIVQPLSATGTGEIFGPSVRMPVDSKDAVDLILEGRLHSNLPEQVLDDLRTLDDLVFDAQKNAPWYVDGLTWSRAFPPGALKNRPTFIRYLDAMIERLMRQGIPEENINTIRFLRRQVANGGDVIAREAAGFGIEGMPTIRTAAPVEYLPGRIPEHQMAWTHQQIMFLAQTDNVSLALSRGAGPNLRGAFYKVIDEGNLFIDMTKLNRRAFASMTDDFVKLKGAVRNISMYGVDEGLEGLTFSKNLDFLRDPRETPSLFGRVLDKAGDWEGRIVGAPPRDYLVGSPSDMLRRLTYDQLGHTVNGRSVYPGAVAITQGAMLDYNTFSRGDQIMKIAMPFWQFHSRTFMRNLELMATQPRMFYFYVKYRQYSQLYAMKNGFVDSRGKAIRRTSGTMRIPGTNVWVDPFQAMSVRMLFLNRLENIEEGLGEDLPLSDIIGNIVFDIAGPVGLSLPPWWTEALFQAGVLDPDKYPRRSAIPFTDVFIPPWDQKTIQGWLPASLAEALDISQNPGDPKVWGSNLPWKDLLVEQQIYQWMLREIALIEADGSQERMEEFEKIRVDGLAALGYSPIYDEEGNLVDYRMNPYNQHPVYLDALHEVEARSFYPSRVGHYTGIYGKYITDEDAELYQLRLRNNEMRALINNSYGAHVFMLDPTPEIRYANNIERRFNTPEGYVANLFANSAWVEVPQDTERLEARGLEGLEPGEQAYGLERKELLGQSVFQDEVNQAYYDSVILVKTNLDASLKICGPVGAGFSAEECRSQAFKTFFDAFAQLESGPMYSLAERPSSALFIGTKPESMVIRKAQDGGYYGISMIEPQWDRENETFTQFELRLRHFEDIEFPLAMSYIAGTIRGNLERGFEGYETINGVRVPAGTKLEDGNFILPNRTVISEKKVELGEVILWDGRITSIDDLVDEAISEMDFEGYQSWVKSRHTPLQALNEAWRGASTYDDWFRLLEELDAQGANRDEKKVAQDAFIKEFGDGPTDEELIDWIMENYPEGQFTEAELQRILDETGISGVEQRLEDVSPERAFTSDVWDFLSWVPPGASDDFRTAFEAVGGDLDLYDNWFEFSATLGFTQDAEDREKVDQFLIDIKEAMEKLGWTEPDTPTRKEWGVVKDLNADFEEYREDFMSKEFGFDWETRFGEYMEASSSARRALKKLDVDLGKLVSTWFDLRCQQASSQPLWSKYYMDEDALERCKKGAGGTGAGRARRGRGRGGGARGTGASDFIGQGYRVLGPGQRYEQFDPSKLGEGGIAGIPWWPAGLMKAMGAAADDVVKMIEKDKPLPNRAKELLIERAKRAAPDIAQILMAMTQVPMTVARVGGAVAHITNALARLGAGLAEE